jgi:hypothetical protein
MTGKGWCLITILTSGALPLTLKEASAQPGDFSLTPKSFRSVAVEASKQASAQYFLQFCSFFVCIVCFSPNTSNPQTIWCVLTVFSLICSSRFGGAPLLFACTLLFNLQLSFVLVFFVSSIVTSFDCSLYQWDVVFILKKIKLDVVSVYDLGILFSLNLCNL